MIRYLKNYSIKNDLSILCKPLSFGDVYKRQQCNLLVRHVHTVNFLVALFGFTGNIELKEVVAERLTYRMTGTVHVLSLIHI